MKENTLYLDGNCEKRNHIVKSGISSNLKSFLGILFVVAFSLLGSDELYAQLDCDHDPETFSTSDPSCPETSSFNIAKIDRPIIDEILYVKVSGDACCGDFLINPKNGQDCYFETIAGPSGPDVDFLEIGTIPDSCDLGELTQCSDANNEVIIECESGLIGHRIQFLGRIEDGTESYWYYHVENNVDSCISDISHFAFGLIDDSVCCIDYEMETSAVCENENAMFTVTPSGADNYLFFLDENEDGIYNAGEELQDSNVNTYTSNALAPGDTVGVVVTSADAQCTDTNIINAIIYDLPVVTADDKSVCIGGSVQLTGTPDNGVWTGTNVEDGWFNAGDLPAGEYTVTYTFEDNNGCVNSADATVVIKNLPVVTADDKSVCIGGSVQLTGTPDDGVWTGTNVEDGWFNAGDLPAGEYTVTYTFEDNNGCVDSADATVVIKNLPVVTADDKSVCIGGSVQLTGTPDNGVWTGTNVEDGWFNAGDLPAGEYTVTYTFEDNNGCVNSADATVVIKNLPVVTADDKSVCIGGSVQLTGTPDNGVWTGTNVEDGWFNAGDLPAGEYTVTYTFEDNNGCVNSADATVVIKNLPVVTADDKSVCIGGSVQLTGTPDNGVWTGTNVEEGWFNAGDLPAGEYTVTYTFEDNNGCVNSADATVIIKNLPVVTADDKSVCIGGSVQLTGTPDDGVWTGTNVEDGWFNAGDLPAGEYTVTYTFEDNNGCVDSADATVVIKNLPVVTADDNQYVSGAAFS